MDRRICHELAPDSRDDGVDNRLDDGRSIDGDDGRGRRKGRTQDRGEDDGGREATQRRGFGGRGGTGESKSKPRIESSMWFVDVPFEFVGEVPSACSVTEASHVQGGAAARHVGLFVLSFLTIEECDV